MRPLFFCRVRRTGHTRATEEPAADAASGIRSRQDYCSMLSPWARTLNPNKLLSASRHPTLGPTGGESLQNYFEHPSA